MKYKDAGVDISKADEAKKEIKSLAQSTYDKNVLAGIGPFGAMYELTEVLKKYKEPVLVQSIDGVGTKLMIARMMGKFDTVGQDIVNHCVNDILCQGAKPLTFLDYVTQERLEPNEIKEIVKGICVTCKENDFAVVGGETAEMPGVYKPTQWDLAGTITGIVEKDKVISGENIKPGDKIIGLASNGLHTNGYSLARKIFFEERNWSVNRYIPELKKTLGEELLRPHQSYLKPVLKLLERFEIKGIAHITGGGLPGNLKRILPEKRQAQIKLESWPVPPIFKLIQKEGKVPKKEMFRTFNMGIGMVLVVPRKYYEPDELPFDLSFQLEQELLGLESYLIGEIVEGERIIKFTP